MTDLLLTWPKTRPLSSYLRELELAAQRGQLINFRVRTLPKDDLPKGTRIYMVHDGAIRGYNLLHDMRWMGEGRVLDPASGGYMRAGWYIQRDPRWHPIDPVPHPGFRGYRFLHERYD